MDIDTTTHTHIQTRNTTGQVCSFKRDTIGWVWASTGRRISNRFLSTIVDRMITKPGANAVFYTPA